MDKFSPAVVSDCHASIPSDPCAVASVAPGATLSSTGAVSTFQQRVDGKKNAKKRHSFTTVSLTHRSSQAASHRHSVEISAPVLISSSDPRATARIRDLVHMSCSAPAQVTSSGSGRGGTGHPFWDWGLHPQISAQHPSPELAWRRSRQHLSRCLFSGPLTMVGVSPCHHQDRYVTGTLSFQ